VAVEEPPATQQQEIITTTQWFSVISICVSLLGIYYKRKQIKKMLTGRPPSPVDTIPPRKGIRLMD